jgi:hypothetical protein
MRTMSILIYLVAMQTEDFEEEIIKYSCVEILGHDHINFIEPISFD